MSPSLRRGRDAAGEGGGPICRGRRSTTSAPWAKRAPACHGGARPAASLFLEQKCRAARVWCFELLHVPKSCVRGEVVH
uniref:Uncharacterized protein n=1 Tax=Setaria italica TaxID=4555 RepID=K3XUA5_SETIT